MRRQPSQADDKSAQLGVADSPAEWGESEGGSRFTKDRRRLSAVPLCWGPLHLDFKHTLLCFSHFYSLGLPSGLVGTSMGPRKSMKIDENILEFIENE